MARKTKEDFKKHIIDLKEFQWDFIRKDKGYINDCEKWSGRKKAEWRSSEIILGYKFSGNLNTVTYLGSKLYSKALWNYYDKYSIEWGNLITTPEEVKMLQEGGLHPTETEKRFTWHRYWKKWDINLPLNPLCDFVPFFVNIKEEEVITEPFSLGVSDKTNDYFLDRGTKSYIKVNWALPKEHITSVFEGVLDVKQLLLKEKGIPTQRRPPMKKYEKYRTVLELRMEGKTYSEIAEQVYPKEATKNLNSAINRVKENYKAVKKIIYGLNKRTK